MKEYGAFSLYPDTLRALHHPHPDSPLLGRGGGGQMLAVARRNVRRGKEREKEEGGIEAYITRVLALERARAFMLL